MPVPPEAVEKTKMVMEAHRASVSKAIGAGVKVAMGTDSGVTPHGRNLARAAVDGRVRDVAGRGAGSHHPHGG